ncbi:pimeloyl-ACP methyl ester esterase BioH [Nitrosomonas sp. Nm34]|uniref:pimeloyl-ACP methyl ester esterase BioH n=1 Tax=Nitrosomonas sp. Nm34 TaxID=1881055 RepID=UPI0008E9FDBE|nr:pimeloyl-ACP methyl ester esterase BioH [Nitrosomonas sp. Nm34]SFI55334.1 pimeloyl-[acyl-carrier protein] methyl ester esterase [Nitrosomonas sp. Nm34]
MSRLHVEISGKGPDLVMLHGWAMHSGIWGGIRDQLARHFRLHLVDLPGHGQSSMWESYSLEAIVASVAEILPAESIVCGWSLGGQVALKLALSVPTQVSQLVLVATTPCFVKRVDWQWGMDQSTLLLFMENLEHHYTQTLNRFFTLQVNGGCDMTQVLAQIRDHFFQHKQPDGHALRAGLQILLTTDLREKLADISQPVLLLHGENDVITHVDAAKWMHQQLPHARLVSFPHCGHAPFLSHPNQFITSLYDL